MASSRALQLARLCCRERADRAHLEAGRGLRAVQPEQLAVELHGKYESKQAVSE